MSDIAGKNNVFSHFGFLHLRESNVFLRYNIFMNFKSSRILTFSLLILLSTLLVACTLELPAGLRTIFRSEKPEAARDVTEDPEEPISPFATREEIEGMDKIYEIMDQNRSVECTFEYEERGEVLTGRIYSDGERLIISHDMALGPERVSLNSLYRDGTLYTWVEGELHGTKVDIDQPSTLTEPTPTLPDYIVDMDYTCEEVELSGDLFILPQEVDFSEVTMPEAPEIGRDTEANLELMCSGCEAYEDPTLRERCKEALGCE